jgi:hypothetical protein
MSDILEMAVQIRDKLADPEKAKRIERKREQTEKSALELRALIGPLAGQKAAMKGERGFFHVRADQHAAYLEFVPNERFTVETKFDGRVVNEQRERPGKAPTERLTLQRGEQGFLVEGFGLPKKAAAQVEDVKRYVAAVVGPLLEP